MLDQQQELLIGADLSRRQELGLARLYEAYAEGGFCAGARLLGPQTSDVADVVQETMMAARSAATFDPSAGFALAVALGHRPQSRALHLRKQERRDRLTKASAWLAASNGELLHWLEGKEPSPPAALAAGELGRLVRDR